MLKLQRAQEQTARGVIGIAFNLPIVKFGRPREVALIAVEVSDLAVDCVRTLIARIGLNMAFTPCNVTAIGSGKRMNMRLLKTLVVTTALLFMCGQVHAQESTYGVEAKSKTYAEAYRDAQAGDKPLLVLVSATWCPPCQVMKQTTIPQLIEKDAFKDFHYATVDLDQEEHLAKQLIGNRGLPQFIMFEKNEGKWVRRYLKGIQSVATVEAFVAQASSYRTADAGFEVIGK